ncbi:putative nuclease HARBI1 [Ostrinia nubilalis]|uniref:putative nuclease HARBI1 n=1 Tax=Ostrinia nubilalis TaxID=29057 RepID=UPI003082429D
MWRFGRRNNFLIWHYLEALRDEEEAGIHQKIIRRNILRKNFNPAAVSEGLFQQQYRLNKPAFRYLCDKLRERTSLKATKRVPLEHKVLCALHFYASGSYQCAVGMMKHLGQTTVSKYINEVTNALNDPNILNELIKFPQIRTERNQIRQKFYTEYGVPGVIGCIDASHFHIRTPKKEIENLFFCRKQYCSLNVQMICDSDGRILNVNPKYGGATHDAFIWQNSSVNEFMQRLHRENEITWLLGDSGYPQQPWMMTPIPDAVVGSPEAKYSSMHGRAWVIIENTFGRLRNQWCCLGKDRSLHYKPEKCAKIILACCALHNLALDYGISDPDDTIIEEVDDFSQPEVATMSDGRDDLIRGRALRSQLVDLLNRS